MGGIKKQPTYGCLVCGQVLGKETGLLCTDCSNYNYMKDTGTKARYVEITADGPVDVTEQVEEWQHDSYMRWNEDEWC